MNILKFIKRKIEKFLNNSNVEEVLLNYRPNTGIEFNIKRKGKK